MFYHGGMDVLTKRYGCFEHHVTENKIFKKLLGREQGVQE